MNSPVVVQVAENRRAIIIFGGIPGHCHLRFQHRMGEDIWVDDRDHEVLVMRTSEFLAIADKISKLALLG